MTSLTSWRGLGLLRKKRRTPSNGSKEKHNTNRTAKLVSGLWWIMLHLNMACCVSHISYPVAIVLYERNNDPLSVDEKRNLNAA